MPYTFEEKYNEVLDVVRKYNSRWHLDALRWLDYEDVSSEIVTHVWKKWHQWNQERPLAPWVSTICKNQIFNKLRNNFTNYARPCIKCPNNLEGTHCSATSNHEQCSECPIYAHWMTSKKSAYDIKLPLELENHKVEINNIPFDEVDYDLVMVRLINELTGKLDEKSFAVFKMANLDKKTDKEIVSFLKLKPKPGLGVMKQLTDIKANILASVKIIIKESDIQEMLQ